MRCVPVCLSVGVCRYLRLLALMLAAVVPALACNLTNPALTPPPTTIPQQPVIGVQPASGPPGTIITVAVAGFPAGAKVNLLATADGNPTPAVLARDLMITDGGGLNFAFNLPAQIGTQAINKTTTLTMIVQTADGAVRASAVFVATPATTGGGGQLPATATTSSGGGVTTPALFITAPPIGSVHGGARIAVTGSGANWDNTVYVQITNSALQVLASGQATINASAGVVGVWQTTINIAQPPQRTDGFIVAFTLNRSGQLAQQSSIPIVLAGVTVPTLTPTTAPIPIVITNTPWVITATPLP